MSQPFIDWEMVEAKNFGTFRYTIFKVTNSVGKTYYMGWAEKNSWNRSDWFQEAESLEAVRSGVMNLGSQIP